jgi:hypothetical protein
VPYGTILSRVRYNVTGSAAMQAADLANLRDIIREARSEFQREHDLWFLHDVVDTTLVAGQKDYALDTILPRLKAIEDVWILSNGAPLWQLFPLDKDSLIHGYRTKERYSGQPDCYEAAGGYLSFYPIPGTTYPVRIYCVRYLEDLPTDVTEFDDYEDDLSRHAEAVLIYRASVIACGGRDNQTRAQFYNEMLDSARASLLLENRKRRDVRDSAQTIPPRW